MNQAPSLFASRPRARDWADSVRDHAATLFGLLTLMWAVEIADWALPFWEADRLGIRPRSVPGLLGIVAAPFLHGGFGHLVANSVPFIILGGIVMLGGRGLFWAVTIFCVVAGGFAVWLLAPGHSIHLGASGLIFGYFGFLLSRGIFERSIGWAVVAGLLLLAYGGMMWGVLPGQPGVSWQGHLFGFAAGVAAAWGRFRGNCHTKRDR